MRQHRQITTVVSLALLALAVACSGVTAQDTKTKQLQQLKAERQKLVERLREIDAEISKLEGVKHLPVPFDNVELHITAFGDDFEVVEVQYDKKYSRFTFLLAAKRELDRKDFDNYFIEQPVFTIIDSRGVEIESRSCIIKQWQTLAKGQRTEMPVSFATEGGLKAYLKDAKKVQITRD